MNFYRYTCSCFLPGSLGYEAIDVQMLLDFEIDYFKYDNCYPRLDGSTQCFIPILGAGIGESKSFLEGKVKSCDDGCGAYIDLRASLKHFPSLWQNPSEESR